MLLSRTMIFREYSLHRWLVNSTRPIWQLIRSGSLTMAAQIANLSTTEGTCIALIVY